MKVLASLGAAALLVGATPASSAPSQSGDCAWQHVPAPEPQPVMSLNDIVGLGSEEAWAVGVQASGGEFDHYETLVMHLDDAGWSIVESPNEGQTGSRLHSVAASSPVDVWAVGMTGAGPGAMREAPPPERGLVLHFDGSDWSVVPTPSPRKRVRTEWFADVAALSPTNVWVVGWRRVGDQMKARILHFDGNSWTASRGINRRGRSRPIHGVAAVDHNNLWAVGAKSTAGGGRPLVMRGDGRRWKPQHAPEPTGSVGSSLGDVAATARSDVWAVGFSGYQNASEVLIEHFDGRTWTIVEAPSPGGGFFAQYDYLGAVDAASPTEAWTVGSATPYGGDRRPLVLGWDGTSWTEEAVPPWGDDPAHLDGVAAFGSGEVWAVGETFVGHNDDDISFGPGSDALLLHRSCN